MFIIQVICTLPNILIKCTKTSLVNNNLHSETFAGRYNKIYKLTFVSLVQNIILAKLSVNVLGHTTGEKENQLISSYILLSENQHLQDICYTI